MCHTQTLCTTFVFLPIFHSFFFPTCTIYLFLYALRTTIPIHLQYEKPTSSFSQDEKKKKNYYYYYYYYRELHKLTHNTYTTPSTSSLNITPHQQQPTSATITLPQSTLSSPATPLMFSQNVHRLCAHTQKAALSHPCETSCPPHFRQYSSPLECVRSLFFLLPIFKNNII